MKIYYHTRFEHFCNRHITEYRAYRGSRRVLCADDLAFIRTTAEDVFINTNNARRAYYKYHPRKFSNEYEIISVTKYARRAFNAFADEVGDDINSTIYRISYRQAMREARERNLIDY